MSFRVTCILLTLFFFNQNFAQSGNNPVGTNFILDHDHEQCAHGTIHEKLMLDNPVYRSEQEAREQSLKQLIRSVRTGQIPKSNEILTIPVVVHIIHDGDDIGTGSNISDEQVWSAINGLNEDFRKMAGTNGDGDGADIGVEFCLAVRDPDGNAHSGINRVNGCSVTDYCSEGITAGQGQGANELNVKNLSRWPNQDYYNIWVVTEIENNNGGSGIQGYAYFPTTSPVDGTVILYNAFGTTGNLKSYTNMNRTLTHELGHGFALFHTFHGESCSETNCDLQGDRVCDTPPTTLNSSCSSPACSGTQQVENYMDYTSQTCKNMFTEGQKERMRLSIENSRSNLLNSNGCVPVIPIGADAAISSVIEPSGNICTQIIQPVVVLTNEGSSNLSNTEIRYRTGGSWEVFNWTGLLGPGQETQIVLPEYSGGWGLRTLEVQSQNPNGTADTNPSNDAISVNYQAVQSANTATVNITLDVLGGQTTWEMLDASSNILASGGPYANFQSGSVESHDICLLDGCYEFVIYDAVGNGLCCLNGNGSYEVVDQEGNILASGAEFGDEESTTFCLNNAGGTPPIANFEADNQNPCVGESINFSNLSSGDGNSYEWIFQGATPNSSTNFEPSNITYSDAGTFSVSLSASNTFGTSNETKTNYVTVIENQVWYADTDNDGHGDPDNTVLSCTQPNGYVGIGDDCDDNDNSNWNDCYDCLGVMNGSAQLDNCGTCDNNPNNDCIQDCAGVWGGTATLDNCGTCDDNSDNDCEQDCAGVWGGSAYVDQCGTCDDNPENDCIPCDDLQIELIEVNSPLCFGDFNGQIEIQVTSNSGNYEVEWETGQTTEIISGLAAGTYEVTATSAECTTFLAITLEEPSPLTLSFSNVIPNDCAEENSGALNIEVAGGTPPYQVYYDEQLLNQLTFSGLAGGEYTLSAFDQNGCSTENSVLIQNLTCDSLDVTQLTADLCNSSNVLISNLLTANPVQDAEGYAWEWVDENSLDQIGEYTTEEPFLSPLEFPALKAETSYLIRVKGTNSEIPSVYGEVCQLRMELPTPELLLDQCSGSELDQGETLLAESVVFADNYEFRFEDTETGERYYLYSTDAATVLPFNSQIPPDRDYYVSTRIQHRNVWGGFGQECQLFINAVSPTTGLNSEFCNNFEIELNIEAIQLQPIPGADVYQTVFAEVESEDSVSLQTQTPQILIEQLEIAQPGKRYISYSRVRIDDQWSSWGDTCTIGFLEEQVQLNMEVYPNPSTRNSHVFLMTKGNWQNMQLEFSDMMGRPLELINRDFNHLTPIQIELPAGYHGILLIRATHGKKQLTKKLIVQ